MVVYVEAMGFIYIKVNANPLILIFTHSIIIRSSRVADTPHLFISLDITIASE